MEQTIKQKNSQKIQGKRGPVIRGFQFFLKHFFFSRTHVMVAGFPKSGGTYLVHIIKNLPNMRLVQLSLGTDRREQELSNEKLILYHNKNYVSGNHTRYSSVTQKLIDTYMLHPIVLVRNIFDVVESLYDHFRLESTIIPMAYVPNDISEWDKNKALLFITEMVIPWYFNFYGTWSLCENKLLLTYNDVTKNTFSTISKIVEYSKINCNKNEIDFAIKQASTEFTRKNVGVSGRGNALPEELKEKIRRMASYYPTMDFSPLEI